ncbi:MAG: complex I subunit 1 family protein, partial [Ilumatobacteraceae bacterium]
FNTEYSGIRFALFFLSEFMNVVTMSAIMVTLFFGGPQPLFDIPLIPGALEGTVWFVAKLFVFLYLFVWLRATLPRLRYDQLMDLGWKVLIPISLGWFLLLAALREFSPEGDAADSIRVVLISFVVAVVAVALFGAALKVSARNRSAAAVQSDAVKKGVTT